MWPYPILLSNSENQKGTIMRPLRQCLSPMSGLIVSDRLASLKTYPLWTAGTFPRIFFYECRAVMQDKILFPFVFILRRENCFQTHADFHEDWQRFALYHFQSSQISVQFKLIFIWWTRNLPCGSKMPNFWVQSSRYFKVRVGTERRKKKTDRNLACGSAFPTQKRSVAGRSLN